uniref:Uncharacterized protein n=1 Tax=Branchiostoma floridae TaxID=7739 RepID=C3Y9P8_BRAFL|eukprot:XP_002607294.1 hypothetical protein BRAFLDRAFT_88243 [Branchiostoma floridae]
MKVHNYFPDSMLLLYERNKDYVSVNTSSDNAGPSSTSRENAATNICQSSTSSDTCLSSATSFATNTCQPSATSFANNTCQSSTSSATNTCQSSTSFTSNTCQSSASFATSTCQSSTSSATNTCQTSATSSAINTSAIIWFWHFHYIAFSTRPPPPNHTARFECRAKDSYIVVTPLQHV